MEKLLIEQTEYFSVQQSGSCNVPGYLVIHPLLPAAEIWNLPDAALRELGRLQARCARAIHEAVSPERIYYLVFAEEYRSFHCHLFPRLARATAEYLAEFPRQPAAIRGPLFFQWAQLRFRATAEDVAEDPNTQCTIERIRVALRRLAG